MKSETPWVIVFVLSCIFIIILGYCHPEIFYGSAIANIKIKALESRLDKLKDNKPESRHKDRG